MKAKVLLEIDFKQRRLRKCLRCGKMEAEHFQPPPDADPKLAAKWCPDALGRGYTSFSFTAKLES